MSLGKFSAPDYYWKTAFILPLLKKGNQQCTSNYRPVSLTSLICKVLERIIRSQLLDYMFDRDIILRNQHGFVPKKSTVTNLLECLKTGPIISTIISLIMWYISTTQNVLTRSAIVYYFINLSQYDVTGSAYTRFKNFLTNREQSVKK